MSTMVSDLDKIPDEELCRQVQAAFQVLPCRWQVQVIRELCKPPNRSSPTDLCLISATGSGKTITFLSPLLFMPKGTIVIITPLNLLSEQIAAQLEVQKISAIALSAENASKGAFQAIRDLKYRVVVTNVELAVRVRGEFEKLWRDSKWTSKLICVVWDEAHCISKWADFRPEYKDSARIRRLLSHHVPFFLTSATLPKAVLLDTYRNLGLRASDVKVIHRSNDRPNIHIVVRRMQHPLNSFRDLDFIIPSDGSPPPKFVIFMNNIQQSVKAVHHLRSRLPAADRGRIKWFNSHMSPEFRRDEMENLESGETWGLVCTDSFGLGVDRVRRIESIVQYRVQDTDGCTLWQRMGRAIRSGEGSATAYILVEPKFFDEEREATETRKRKREENESLQAKENKRPRLNVRGHEEGARNGNGSPSTPSDDVAVRRELMFESRRKEYEALSHPMKVKKGRGKGKGGTTALDPVVDDMVNAGSRGFNCYRLPGQLYFENDKIVSDHNDCKPSDAGGCPRCIVRASTICCALCSPDQFPSTQAVLTAGASSEQVLRAAKKKAYDATRDDFILRGRLHAWRTDTTIAQCGVVWMQDFGVSSLMSDETLTRIVDYAHHNRIHSSADLAQHTKWHLAAKYGDSIVKILHEVRPPPTVGLGAPSTGRSSRAGSSANVAPSPAIPVPQPPAEKRIYRCSVCRQTGHKINSRKCTGPPPRDDVVAGALPKGHGRQRAPLSARPAQAMHVTQIAHLYEPIPPAQFYGSY